jgi:hypothetical protein
MKSRLFARASVVTIGAIFGLGGLVTGVNAGGTDDGATETTLPAPVVAESSTITLPLFGAPLTVDIATDPGGALASVSINPADGFTAVADRPNRVAFVNTDGTATVRVTAGHRGDKVKVTGSTINDIVGPGGWSGDVFGTGATTTVGFEIAAKPDGTPDIVNVTTSDSTATIGATEYHTTDRGSSARASVLFATASEKRLLSISASVSTRDDKSKATVSVTLSGARALPQSPADAAGVHTWDGLLCDGTAAHIQYTVGLDGSVSDVTATPDGASVDQNEGRTKVTFATGERIVIKVRQHDDQIIVSAEPAFRCHAADPAVNTPVSTTPDDHGDDIPGSHDGDRDGNHDGDHEGETHDGEAHDGAGRGGAGEDGFGHDDGAWQDDSSTTTTVAG